MKSVIRTLVTLVMGFCFLVMTGEVFAQVLISDGYAEACSGVLYDSSGEGGAGFGPAEDFTLTLCPEDGSNVFLEWINFDLDAASFMTIHDGDSQAAPVLAFSGTGSFLGDVHIASENNASGCLTLKFISSANLDAGGIFGAVIGCGQPCTPPVPVVNASNPSPLYVCPGEEVDFSGFGSISSGPEITTYNWDFDADGTFDFESESPNASHVFDTPGIELVQLSLVDEIGCESIQPTNYFVYISTEPNWNTSVVPSACTGEEVELSLDIEGVSFTLEPGNDFGEAVTLPDNVGECFASEINVNSFLPGAVLLDAGDGVENFMVNMEHSYLGDLDVTFICPNGQEMLVSSYPGPGTSLGIPVMGDTPPVAGEGFDYFWSADATNGTWADSPGEGGTLPSGTYASVSSWGTLDGCPLNGVWQLEICDFWAADNGFVFEWGIDFADTLYPVSQSFTPQFGLLCDSTSWAPSGGDDVLLDGIWNCPELTVTNMDPGVETYTATAMNNFGCEYSLSFDVDYVSFSPVIEATPEVYCGGNPVELTANLNSDSNDNITYTWGPEEFLSDTLGESVTAFGMTGPETFSLVVSQSFGGSGDLVCEALATITIGTCEIIIPNVISPYLSDGRNDMFRIQGIESYDDVELVIMNRWGTTVYENDDFGAGAFWNAAGDGASSGVYYYVLTIPVENGPLVVTSAEGEAVKYEGEGPFVFEGIFHVVD